MKGYRTQAVLLRRGLSIPTAHVLDLELYSKSKKKSRLDVASVGVITCTWGPIVVLGGVSVSYERCIPVTIERLCFRECTGVFLAKRDEPPWTLEPNCGPQWGRGSSRAEYPC